MLPTKSKSPTHLISNLPFLKTLNPKSAFYRYGGAVVIVLLLYLVRALLDPLLQGKAAYLSFLIAVAYSAWSFGVRPALLTVLFSGAIANYFFVQPSGKLGFTSIPEALNFLIFVGISVYIIDLIDRQQRT